MAREAAPGPLALVEDFINSVDLRPYQEHLDSPAALAAWLDAHGLGIDAPLDEADLRRVVAFRETLRNLVASGLGAGLPGADRAALDEAADRARLRLRFRAGGARLEPAAGGLDGVFGRLLAIVWTAMADGSWERFKVCSADDCRWAFYDHSKNHSSAWCSMRSCGNRAKVQAYRRRRGAASA